MRNYPLRIILCVIVLHIASISAEATKAKYAGDFMEVGIGARALGMGGAHVAIVQDVTSQYWNPAGLVSMQNIQLHGMHAERFGGIVNWDYVGIGIPTSRNMAMALGFFRQGVDGIAFTELLDPNKPKYEAYIDKTGRVVYNVPYAYKYVSDSQMAFIFSYAIGQGQHLSYGGNVKIIRKTNSLHGAWGLGFDFGVKMNPYQSLEVGLVLRDATTTWVTWSTGQKELIVPQLNIGVAYSIQLSDFLFLPVFDTVVDFEDRGPASQLSAGVVDWDFRFGLEVNFRQWTALRIGSDRGRLTVGAGFKIRFIQADYGFLYHPDLGETHRISLTLFLNKGNPFSR